MTVEFEVSKVEEVEGQFDVGANDTVVCPLCTGYVFTISFHTDCHVDLHCQKCQAVIHIKTVQGI